MFAAQTCSTSCAFATIAHWSRCMLPHWRARLFVMHCTGVMNSPFCHAKPWSWPSTELVRPRCPSQGWPWDGHCFPYMLLSSCYISAFSVIPVLCMCRCHPHNLQASGVNRGVSAKLWKTLWWVPQCCKSKSPFNREARCFKRPRFTSQSLFLHFPKHQQNQQQHGQKL